MKVYIGGYGSNDADPDDKSTSMSRSERKEKLLELATKYKIDLVAFKQSDLPFLTLSEVPFIDEVTNSVINIPIPNGLTVIFGTQGTGKSTVAEYIADTLKCERIRFGEPELSLNSIVDPVEGVEEIEQFILDDKKTFMVLDSIKYWVYGSRGRSPAGKGGFSTRLLNDLNALSQVCSYYGKGLILVINPNEPDISRLNILVDNIKGNLVSVLYCMAPGEIQFNSRLLISARKNVIVRYELDNDLNVVVDAKLVKPESSIKVDSVIESNVGDKLFSRLFSKQF